MKKGAGIAAGLLVVVSLGAACSKSSPTTAPAPTSYAPVTTSAAAPTEAPGASVQATIKDFTIVLSTNTVPSGTVNFDVTNDGPATHEFVVLRTGTSADGFKIGSFEGESGRINETGKDVTNVGETGDMKPGATKTLSIEDMSPGHYAIVCNLPGHYGNGMHEDFTVT